MCFYRECVFFIWSVLQSNPVVQTGILNTCRTNRRKVSSSTQHPWSAAAWFVAQDLRNAQVLAKLLALVDPARALRSREIVRLMVPFLGRCPTKNEQVTSLVHLVFQFLFARRLGEGCAVESADVGVLVLQKRVGDPSIVV